ncbi:CDP-diacylglycerol--serine O-phosphatidyltransferase [Candidatus Woesearchaeota archaeon]|nr:CDP-diacylglycerol--serine O-phosphatidyltransferase [Candidatus Woesearchaeota archaeon]
MKSRIESRNMQDPQEIRIHKLIKFADFFTLSNAAAGMFAIIFSIQKEFAFAALALLAAVLFDYLDGKIARFSQKQNTLGKNLDSLSDAVSFGIAPTIFGYMQGLNNFFSIIILIFFTLCGVLRLARFNILELKHFIGIPITASGIVFPVLYFLTAYFSIPFSNAFIYIYLLLGILMISSFRIPKLK